jgi:D-alanyl-D-alanine carboxypeptidase
VTLTNAAPPAEPSDVKAGSTARERREAKSRRRRTTRAVVIATLVVVLAMSTGGLAWYLVSETDDLAAQNVVATELLASSDGKVAEETTRVALSAQIGQVDSLLAEPILTRLTTGKADARASLGAASDAVRASMVEFARREVTTARQGLATAGNRGEKVYAATEGKGADDAVRARLRAALDTVTAVDDAANSSLSGTDLAELEQAALDLSSNRSMVTVATQALYDAQDAVTCPAPDQVWDPDSGAVPKAELAPIPWSPTNLVRADVLDGLIALDAAYSKVFGEHLTINSSYRTYDEQKALYDPSSPIAAPPGCSNHGLGLAVDLGGGVETFGTEQYSWLKTNAKAHGWVHPAFAEPDGRVPEPWHWESVLARLS